jgi:hypothetical protein
MRQIGWTFHCLRPDLISQGLIPGISTEQITFDLDPRALLLRRAPTQTDHIGGYDIEVNRQGIETGRLPI